MERTKSLAAMVWQHRVGYAGLALVYGAGCAGFFDSEFVAQLVTVIYAAMTSQRK